MSVARFSSLLLVFALIGSVAQSDEAGRAVIAPEVQQLIKQLDADEFAVRDSASEQLFKLSKEALPALEQGVRSDSPEVATRSFDVLQQLFEKGDQDAKAAAKESLAKLAKGDDRIADQAKKLLEPPPPAVDPNVLPGRGRVIIAGGAVRILGGRIPRAPIPLAPVEEVAVARTAISISSSIGPDGIKTTNVDNDGQKVKIVENPKTGIEGEYTETKDGKETTQKFAAKDAEELKTKHPEAFKLYEKYAKHGGAVRIDLAGEVVARAAAPRGTREHFEELLKKLDDQIASVTKEIEISKADKDGRTDVLTRRLESYGRIRELYKRQIKELEAKELEVPKKPVEPKPDDGGEGVKIEIEIR
jgi:hypothetical protein